MSLKFYAKKMLRAFGIDIKKYDSKDLGASIDDDVINILKLIDLKNQAAEKITIFDVGANIGQSIFFYNQNLSTFQRIIHAFEPSPKTFALLENNCKKLENIILVNKGLGSSNGHLTLYENEQSDVSSFLKPTDKLWGKQNGSVDADVTTLDSYCKIANVERIDFLKIDTQGFDLHVVQGAVNMINNGSIKLVQMEITLEDLYEGLPRIDHVLTYMLNKGFKLVGFYGFHNLNISARWTDALFVHNSILI